MVATVSHEFRTPLNSILSIVEILENKIKSDSIQRYVSVLKNSSKLLLSIVNALLDFETIKSQTFKLNLVE